MIARFLFLAIMLSQVSGCIATPRLFSTLSDDYEPPEKEQVKEHVAEPQKRELSPEAKEEIRRQVQEEIRLQNSVKPK